MNNRNKVQVIGNIVEDVTEKQAGKTTVANPKIAVNSSYVDKETSEIIQKTVYLEFTWWKPSTLVKHLKKGALVKFEGEIKNDIQVINGVNIHGIKLILKHIDILKFVDESTEKV